MGRLAPLGTGQAGREEINRRGLRSLYRQPITDIRDVIHSIALVDQIEAAEIMAART